MEQASTPASQPATPSSTPAATSSPTTPATTAATPKPAFSAKAVADRVNAELAASKAASTSSPAAAETPPATRTSAQTSAETPPAQASTPGESATPSAPDTNKLQEALKKLTRSEADAITHKQTAEKSTARVAELEAQLKSYEEARGDVNKLLAMGKITPEKLGDMFLKGELKFDVTPDQPKLELPAEYKEMFEEHQSQKAKAAQEAARVAAEKQRAEDLGVVKETFAPLADEYPLLAALPRTADALLDGLTIWQEQNPDGQVDFKKHVSDAHAAVQAELGAVFGHKPALKAMLADPNTRTLVTEVLKELGAPVAAPEPVAQQRTAPASPVSKTLTRSNSAAVPSQSSTKASLADTTARINRLKAG